MLTSFFASTLASMCISLNAYHEARSDGIDGMTMVAQVTLNRAGHDPAKACQVVAKRKQFSWTNRLTSGDKLEKIRMLPRLLPKEAQAWQDAREIGRQAVSGTLDKRITQRVGSAKHYYNPSKANPSWRRDYKQVAMIGEHLVLI